MAVKLDTTGRVLRKPFDVVKKFNIVVTPMYLTNVCNWKNNINIIYSGKINIILNMKNTTR